MSSVQESINLLHPAKARDTVLMCESITSADVFERPCAGGRSPSLAISQQMAMTTD